MKWEFLIVNCNVRYVSVCYTFFSLLFFAGILSNGKSLHSSIECYLRGTPPEEISIAEPNQGHWNSLNAILASIDHVHVLESHVIHPKLQYCGVIDCVAEFRFVSSSSSKKWTIYTLTYKNEEDMKTI